MKNIFPVLLGCVGVALIVHSKPRVADEITAHEINPLDLKGSPYGEIIGMALQEPVHLLWHGGKGHEHVSAEGEDCEVCGTDHAEDGVSNYLKDKPWSAKLKLKMLSMENSIRQNNNPGVRSATMISFEQQRAKDLMLWAYEMDPTNYGNYNAVSYFYQTGGSAVNRAKVDQLAQRTLAACEGRLDDPEDCLTAASAAYNILLRKSAGLAHEEYQKIASDFDLFLEKIALFESSLQRAIADERIKNYSQEKVDEMVEHHNQFYYTVRGYQNILEDVNNSIEE